MAPPRRPRSPPALMDDLIGEILLRVPPDEPAHLIRAALVCKPWRRILFDPAFLRRYREFHRTPPLLGFLRFSSDGLRFVPTTTPSPFTPENRRIKWWRALDCRHGRVLLRSSDELVLCDPLTGDLQRIPMPEPARADVISATVLCPADSCNHLDCHSGPFLVVVVVTDYTMDDDNVTWMCEYSSETGAWSALMLVDFTASNIVAQYSSVDTRPSLFTGNAVYFTVNLGDAILKYDLRGRGLSVIDAPVLYKEVGGIMMAEDSGLGYAVVKDYNLYLWSWKSNAKGIPDKKVKVIPEVIGFAEGTDTIFISTNDSIVTLKLKSGKVRRVSRRLSYGAVVPYMSFYAPDLVGVKLLPP